MPAIDAAIPSASTAPTAPTEARPGSQAAANSGKADETGATDNPAGDAFIAALLAQSTMPQATPAVPVAGADGGPLVGAGQDLPAMRPTLATAGAPRGAVSSLGADNLPTAAVATDAEVDGAQDDFATAFAALQDAMTGGAGGERGEQSAADSTTAVGSSAALGDLTGAAPGGATHAEHSANQALDALAGAHAARAQEAPAAAQAYAAKPAPLPMDQPALFAERLNQHVSFMIGDQIQTAQIAVTPADLGPVEVRVTMVGDDAKIQLTATHAATREALNEALPRLRASFAEAGISLSQAGVFAQMPERQRADPSFSGQHGSSERDFGEAPRAAVAPVRMMRVGLIDAFV